MQKRSAAEHILFAGFFLALSTQTISHQDALFRFEAGVESTDRWQVHVIARNQVDGSGREQRFAALIGPGVDDGAAVRIDPTVTGAVRVAAINRRAKTDGPTRNEQPAFVAGRIGEDALFDPIVVAPDSPRMAFVRPAALKPAETDGDPATDTPNAAVAAAASAESPDEDQPAAPAKPPALLAYAPSSDDSEGAFDAVMGDSSKGQIVLDPDIGANHKWVNYAVPASSRSKKETRCLANAIYFEARSEPERGRIAVAQVVINRLKNPAYPNTLCSVVYQNKHKRNACQFSFACDGIRDRVSDKKSWAEAQALAKRILNDDRTLFLDDIGASTHYHATYVRPRWARKMKKMKKVGRHIFYKTYGGGWS